MLQGATEQPQVTVPTPYGRLQVQVVPVNGKDLLVVTSEVIPAIPIVRFQSSCVFGEAFHAIDCDCGAQVTAALTLIGQQGGVLIYAWEEGRGTGITEKLKAIALQQTLHVSTSQAFEILGHDPDPRTFEAHLAALRKVVPPGAIKLASSNPKKVAALEAAGYTVERIRLKIDMTPERKAYLAHKQEHLGHFNDD